jgi:hypothetical protein
MADDDKKTESSPTSGGQGNDGDSGQKPTETPKPRVKPKPPVIDQGGVTMRWEIPNFDKKSDF